MILLRELRQARGMTQVQLAEALGVTSRAVQGFELGNWLPSLQTLVKLREIFGDEAVLRLLDEVAEHIKDKEAQR